MSLSCIAPLFVPADRPERYAKAAASGADAVIIDLEDAVAPHAKTMARDALCKPGALPAGASIIVRINAVGSTWHDDDVAAMASLRIAGIMLPKAENAAEVTQLAAALHGVPIIALIESARGLAAARDIACNPGTTRLAFGSIDFCADLGAVHTRETLLVARAEIVLASRLGNLTRPLDGVTVTIGDDSLLEDDARYGNGLGFGGKLCIHPSQVNAVRRGFRPSAEEIAWARRIMSVDSANAIAVDGTMVDAPVRLRATQILASASA